MWEKILSWRNIRITIVIRHKNGTVWEEWKQNGYGMLKRK